MQTRALVFLFFLEEEDLYYVAPSLSPSINFRENRAGCSPRAHVTLNIYPVSDLRGGARGERFLRCGSIPLLLSPRGPETQHPVIEAPKCGCHFLPAGHG